MNSVTLTDYYRQPIDIANRSIPPDMLFIEDDEQTNRRPRNPRDIQEPLPNHPVAKPPSCQHVNQRAERIQPKNIRIDAIKDERVEQQNPLYINHMEKAAKTSHRQPAISFKYPRRLSKEKRPDNGIFSLL